MKTRLVSIQAFGKDEGVRKWMWLVGNTINSCGYRK